MGKIASAELGADTKVAGGGQQLLFKFDIPKGTAVSVTGGGQIVIVMGGDQFDRLQGCLGAGAADDEGQVVRRAGGRAKGFHLFDKKVFQGIGIEQGFGLLVQVTLVGAAAAFGDKEKTILVTCGGIYIYLGRQVGAGVDLLIHGQWRVL